jgi:hypothetical protein
MNDSQPRQPEGDECSCVGTPDIVLLIVPDGWLSAGT